MRTDYSFLCDYADASGPKVHAIGIGFDTIFVAQPPGGLSSFWFVAQLAASAAEVGQKMAEIKLMGPDGHELVNSGGPVVVAEPPVPGQPSRFRIATQFAGVQFPAYGVYAVSLVINGTEMTSISLIVAPPPAPPATA